VIDLDAVIAAEVKGDPIPVKVGGKTFKLLPEMPWEAPVLIGKDDARGALACLSVNGDGDKFADAVLADHPTLKQVAERMATIYGLGESSASPRSSTNGGTRSRPTSKGSTRSTSAAP
jgi:hypothetical protein